MSGLSTYPFILRGVAMRRHDLELESILDQGESFRVDYKERLDGNAPTSIREAVCSFANDLPRFATRVPFTCGAVLEGA